MENYPKSFVLCSNEFGIGYVRALDWYSCIYIYRIPQEIHSSDVYAHLR